MDVLLVAEPKKGRGGKRLPPDREKSLPPPPDPGQVPPPAAVSTLTADQLGGNTAVKVYELQRDVITQTAALLGLNQQDTMLRYLRMMQDDLARLIARRQAELQHLFPPEG